MKNLDYIKNTKTWNSNDLCVGGQPQPSLSGNSSLALVFSPSPTLVYICVSGLFCYKLVLRLILFCHCRLFDNKCYRVADNCGHQGTAVRDAASPLRTRHRQERTLIPNQKSSTVIINKVKTRTNIDITEFVGSKNQLKIGFNFDLVNKVKLHVPESYDYFLPCYGEPSRPYTGPMNYPLP